MDVVRIGRLIDALMPKPVDKVDESSVLDLEELDGPVDTDADRAWLDEVQRRSAEFDAGRVKTITSEQVFERVRARLKQ